MDVQGEHTWHLRHGKLFLLLGTFTDVIKIKNDILISLIAATTQTAITVYTYIEISIHFNYIQCFKQVLGIFRLLILVFFSTHVSYPNH